MSGPFKVVVADPPWLFDDNLPGETKGAARNYRCMSTYDVCRYLRDARHDGMSIASQVADDAALFLWRVAAMQQSALDVVSAWDFTVKSEVIWLKKTVAGGRWFGMGRTLRAEHEVCLLAVRRRPLVLSHSIRTTIVTEEFEGFSAAVGRHSEKPEKFYEIVEQLFAGPYLELFARRQRPGWTCLGDEACT